MRALELALALQLTTGASRAAIEQTQLAIARDAYVRDVIDLAQFEQLVEHVLDGGDVAMLQPGERVLRPTPDTLSRQLA